MPPFPQHYPTPATAQQQPYSPSAGMFPSPLSQAPWYQLGVNVAPPPMPNEIVWWLVTGGRRVLHLLCNCGGKAKLSGWCWHATTGVILNHRGVVQWLVRIAVCVTGARFVWVGKSHLLVGLFSQLQSSLVLHTILRFVSVQIAEKFFSNGWVVAHGAFFEIIMVQLSAA